MHADRALADACRSQVGDWGRQGNANQLRAAQLMARVAAECMHPNFIISSGDNFYESGLRAANDPQIDESFNNVYSDPSLQVRMGHRVWDTGEKRVFTDGAWVT